MRIMKSKTKKIAVVASIFIIIGIILVITIFGGKPTPNFSYSITAIGVQFTDESTSSFGIFQRHWDFGDGNTSTEQNPIHDYKSPGIRFSGGGFDSYMYNAILTITDFKGSSISISQDISIPIDVEIIP